jgi:hypothetical protein
MSIETLKYELFAKIMNIQNEAVLQRVKELIEQISNENDLLNRVIKPVREKITVDDLIKEQNYKGFDRDAFNELAARMDIKDPIEELLALTES